jgi:hypothetical protein
MRPVEGLPGSEPSVGLVSNLSTQVALAFLKNRAAGWNKRPAEGPPSAVVCERPPPAARHV